MWLQAILKTTEILEMEYKNKEMNEEKTLALEKSESEETTMVRTTTKEVGRLASFIPL